MNYIKGALYKGRAQGGPMDGVLLEAQYTWDGRIRLYQNSNSLACHPGRYYWNGKTWVWWEDKTGGRT